MKNKPKSIELCAGGGGQALGLEQAGFDHVALIDNERDACSTLRLNRSKWNVIETDLKSFDARPYKGIDIVTGGVPCQPFSIGGKQLGDQDERDLFPQAIRIVTECSPRAFLFENVRGLADRKFDEYRNLIIQQFEELGYYCEWRVINSVDFGVPQKRLRFILVGRQSGYAPFPWPKACLNKITVGETLQDLMAANGWKQIKTWLKTANNYAPCVVGGSKKHGGPDLGPVRARNEWKILGVNGIGLGDEAPHKDHEGLPKLTNRMVARLQGFPDDWNFFGGKTTIYRQIGNAFPPPVAKALGIALKKWLGIPAMERPISAVQNHQLSLALAS